MAAALSNHTDPSPADLLAVTRLETKRALRHAQAANRALAQLEDRLAALGIGLVVEHDPEEGTS